MARAAATKRTFDALPDTIDFRDAIFTPTLIRVAPESDISAYYGLGIPVLDQGREGACTGFGLATVANYLLRVRERNPAADEVSAWMLYAMAKRYDEWPGQNYEGSSARGAMKGWFKHGLCAYALWKERDPDPTVEEKRSADALARPLGAYFRVNHKDLVGMHAAINETGILYATARVHDGWQSVKPEQENIEYRPGQIGGHAFAIVGYNRRGFWVQNSWGEKWGAKGLANLSYTDWLANGTDVWVASLGAPVDLTSSLATANMRADAPRSYQSQVYADLRPYIITSKNNGVLDDKGTYGLTPAGLKTLITERMPRAMSSWQTRRVLLYAHGGLVGQDGAVQTVSSNLAPLLQSQVYPLSFIWRSDVWTTLSNILRDAIGRRRDEGLLDKAKDFMLDRLDDTLEVGARNLGGKALWDEMKENARMATEEKLGSANLVTDHLIKLHKDGEIDEVHLVGHSAGSIFHAPVVSKFAKAKVPLKTVSLWAPACTVALFNETYLPALKKGMIEKFDLYTLDDPTEQDDDCAGIYHKSLLYLVSNAFEKTPHIPALKDGVPILGMERFAKDALGTLFDGTTKQWNLAPGPASKARHHGDFDNDEVTLLSTLHRVLDGSVTKIAKDLAKRRPTGSNIQKREFRQSLDQKLGQPSAAK
ncbi:peptidase C1 [Mesorhizobium sp. M7A.F.Ca.MR.176.00.0.0]|uniref:C1 family peptidase n=1 Tax=unclassified Mesorhizobium TaxID=325217 RepID=UPI000FD50709|nr:C1 family peptidase [Mesorhizobium sp. M7A.F.Ca.MR.176.00.0.0]RUU93101.1 peptidase C1 [Mesorhizobium sp. M7A.F.Ca.MR.176.00.0.0]